MKLVSQFFLVAAVAYITAVLFVGVVWRPHAKDPCTQGSTRCNPRAQ